MLRSIQVNQTPNFRSGTTIVKTSRSVSDKKLNRLKKGVWLYFWLLIFEGALRKWILPELATPLLIIRDPIAIWLLYQSFQYRVFRPNTYVIILWSIMGLSLVTTMLFGHGNATVALYGARIFIVQFPVIFVIAKVFTRDDVIALGKTLLWVSLGMTLIVALQFFSPQSAWINRGLAGDMEGSGFSGAGGFYRVPGTFSFTNGLSLFYGFVSAYIFYFWIDNKDKKVPQWLLLISTFSLFAAIPLSISRTTLLLVVLSFVFSQIAGYRNPKFLGRLITMLAIGFVLLLLLGNLSFFQTSTKAFTQRFTTANEAEGGLSGVFLDRFLGGMLGALTTDKNQSFWGLGLGMGTSAGAKLMTGNVTYLIAEGEWGRLIGEMGILLGLTVIFMRIKLFIDLLKKSWQAIKWKNSLPWLLLGFDFLLLIQGQFGQPTSLGFAVLTTGLVFGGLNYTKVSYNTKNE